MRPHDGAERERAEMWSAAWGAVSMFLLCGEPRYQRHRSRIEHHSNRADRRFRGQVLS